MTLWSVPGENPEIKKAIRENRILSVKQEPRGHKMDFGEIGFKEEKNVSYFIFPKSLRSAKEARVVGIKYDLVEQPKVTDVVKAKEMRKPKSKKERVNLSGPRNKRFFVVVRKTAVWETTLNVEAPTRTEAEREAKTRATAKSIPFSEAIVDTTIRQIREEE